MSQRDAFARSYPLMAVLMLSACSSKHTAEPSSVSNGMDASRNVDMSAADASAADASATDASATDASATDASATDASATDASAIDPSAIDPSATDAPSPRVVGHCPVDTQKPIPVRVCNDLRESPDGKWSAADAVLWQSASEDSVFQVLVDLRGGLVSCPQSGESGAAYDYRREWNRQTQRCVRETIDELGGKAQDTVSQVNAIFAEVTWSQIQEVAELPDVILISNIGPIP